MSKHYFVANYSVTAEAGLPPEYQEVLPLRTKASRGWAVVIGE